MLLQCWQRCELLLHCWQCCELLLLCCHLLADELKLPFRRVRRVVRELFVHILSQPEHYRKPRGQEPRHSRSDPDQHLFVDDDPKDSKLQCSSWAV